MAYSLFEQFDGEYVPLLPSFDNGQFDPVLWSLVHEMRISLIFPLIVSLVARASWRVSLLVGFALSLATIALDHLVYGSDAARHADYFVTGRFIILFIVGALLAKHRERLVAYCRGLSSRSRLLFILLAGVLYSYGWLFQTVH